MYDVVGIDMPCVDFAMNVPSMPKPNSSMHFHRLSFQGGNKVSTGMVAAARLGAKCAILGAVGDEQFGRFCVTDFARHGIDSIIKFRRGETTALSFVLSDDETRGRSIVYHPGTCGRMTIEELPIQVLRDTKYFYLAWMDKTVLYAAKTAKAAGAKIFVDADRPTPEIMEHEYTGAYPMLHFLVTGMLNETNFLPLLENRKVICGGDWMFTQGQALVNNDYALIARNLRESVYQAQDLRNRLAIRK